MSKSLWKALAAASSIPWGIPTRAAWFVNLRSEYAEDEWIWAHSEDTSVLRCPNFDYDCRVR